ncbi:MAG: FAD-dependent thymidylate synthase [Armatimonadota bacterium]
MAHTVVQEAEEILDKEYKVLNHGFVRLVDYMGGDARIVQSARVSYGAGTKTVRDDTRLINYLMRNDHSSPFEQVIFTFHIKMPIFVARQWVRHRTARMNEISGRYSVMTDECYLPERMPLQRTDNKQGSSEESLPEDLSREYLNLMEEDQKKVYEHYQAMIEKGVSREIARINLPLSLYTEVYWQMDLRNLFHFLKLRLDDHAQYEIRCYAEVIAEMVKKVAPIAWSAFEEYVLYAKTFSKSELEEMGEMS